MELETKGLEEAFWERIRRTRTWSGYPLKDVYGPQDIAGLDYGRDLSWPGKHPFTRGSYAQGYRGRLWSTRECTGQEAPSVQNKRFCSQIEQGFNALVLGPVDIPTHLNIDSDHPMAVEEAGRQGFPFDSLEDLEEAMENLPFDKISMCFEACWGGVLAAYVALAEKRGYEVSRLRGVMTTSPLEIMMCHMPKGWKTAEMALREAGDFIEFCHESLPLWPAVHSSPNLWREWSIGAAKEMAIGLLTAREYVKAGLRKGLNIDDVAPRIAISPSGHIDIFEEAAKFRAGRRLWARILKEEFGASDSACRARFMCLTSGARCTYAQPMNNIIRLSYMALGAVLGGVQALGVSGYDEALGLPTEQANMISVRIQQILAHESGAAAVADPLGGSYYVEWLTNLLEEEIKKEMEGIESRGGIAKAVEDGWLERENFRDGDKYQAEIDSGERIVVGVNAYTVPEEEEIHPPVYAVSEEEIRNKIAKLRELKKNRDHEKLNQAMRRLYQAFRNKEQNPYPEWIEAMKLYATTGETFGLFRMAYGLSYDPFGMIECPFAL